MDQIDLSIKSRTLLDMADEVISSDSEISCESSDPASSTELTSITQFNQQSQFSKNSSRKKTKSVNPEIMADLKSNQEILDSFFDTNKTNRSPYRSTKTSNETSILSSKARVSKPAVKPNNSIKKKNVDKISDDERRICELEYQLALAHKELNQEKEIRKMLTNELSSLIDVVSTKSLNITPTSLKATSQLFEKIKTDKTKISSVRLLSKELAVIRKDISEEVQLPNPKITEYESNGAISNALNDVSISLSKDFFNEDVSNIANLGANPLELARTINRMKRAHETGISELKAKIEFLEKRVKEQEQNEISGTISKDTTDLIINLTKRMQCISEQSRREFEDIIENLQD